MKLLSALFCLLAVGSIASTAQAQVRIPEAKTTLPQAQTVGNIEPVALFNGPMPTGVTVSQSRRIFVNFPRWGDRVDFTVAEVINGQAVAYPNLAINRPNQQDQSKSLVSVQSVVVDPQNRLWVLDTGGIEFKPTSSGGPKLIGIDNDLRQKPYSLFRTRIDAKPVLLR